MNADFLRLLALVCLVLPCSVQAQRNPFSDPSHVGTWMRRSTATTSYLVKQGFEGTGYDNGETWTEANSPNPDYTTTVLEGSQSLLCPTTANSKTSFSAQSSLWAFCYFRASVTNGNAPLVLELVDGSNVTVASCRLTSFPKFQLNVGTANFTSSVVCEQGVTYYVWLQYIKGTGANAVGNLYISTTTTRGSAVANRTNGSTTTDATTIRLDSGSGTQHIFDHVRVSASEIGDNPP